MAMMAERGPGDNPEQFFDVLRAMLFYIDEFPERLHHPKESSLLFPRVVRASPTIMAAVEKLESDHVNGEKAVRELQHLLLAWELLGEPRRPAFPDQCKQYAAFYLEHMRLGRNRHPARSRLERTGRGVREKLRSADRKIPARPGL